MAAAVVIGRMATMRLAPTATTVRAFTIDHASTSVATSIDHEDGAGADTDGVEEAGGGVDGAVGSRRSLLPSPLRTRVDVEPAAVVGLHASHRPVRPEERKHGARATCGARCGALAQG